MTPTLPFENTFPGMIPTRASPGVITPGQFGPITVRSDPFMKRRTRTMSIVGTPSVMQMITGISAIMIVEINAPQLRYVTGAISRDEYLSQTLNTYQSLAWLRDHTTPSERILGLENCSDVYAPPFPTYRSNCSFRSWTEAEIENQLSQMHFDFLVLPASNHAPGQSAGCAGRRATRCGSVSLCLCG